MSTSSSIKVKQTSTYIDCIKNVLWKRSCSWWDCCLSPELDPGQNRGGFPQTLPADHLIITYIHSDISQYPSLDSCYVLVLETGCYPDLVRILVHLTISRPTSPCIILCHLPSGIGIHFVFQPSKTSLICKFPLINAINYQTGVANLFIQSFPALCLWK